jgi:SM-20-related protein
MLEIEKVVNDLLTKKFSVIEQIFEENFLYLLHDEITKIDLNNDLQNAGIGRGKKHILARDIRSDRIKWIDDNNHVQNLLFQKLEDLRLELNKNLTLGLFDFESHFAIYKKGDFYKKHLDSFKGRKNRIISLVIYLNKGWRKEDEGILNIYQNINDSRPSFSLVPNFGRAILFLSEEVPHEVIVSKKTRYSIAAWFKVRNMTISN